MVAVPQLVMAIAAAQRNAFRTMKFFAVFGFIRRRIVRLSILRRRAFACQDMKTFRAGRVECAGWKWSPLPCKGEARGEGFVPGQRVRSFKTPHLSPLPVSKGRGEKSHRQSGSAFISRLAPVRPGHRVRAIRSLRSVDCRS